MAKKDAKKVKKADKAAKGKKSAALSENDLTDLISQAAEIEDHATPTKGGGGNYTPAAEGKTVGRFIGYIDLGVQKQRAFEGKPKAAAEDVVLIFELLKDKNIREIEVDGKTVEITDKISVRLKKSTNEKSAFHRLFDKMKNEREEITHFAQMLGEGFVIRVKHDKSKDGKIFAGVKNPKVQGDYMIEPPFSEDEDGNLTVKIKVPPQRAEKRLFIWKLPTMASWNSIFVSEGYNPYQEAILKAENFSGSPIFDLLEGADLLPDLDKVADEDDEDEEDDEELEDEEDSDEDEEEDEEDELDDDSETDDEDDDDEEEESDDYNSDEDEESVDDDESDEEDDVEDEEEAPAPKKPAKKSSPVAVKTKGKSIATAAASAKPAKSPSKKAKGAKGSAKASSSKDAMELLGLKTKKKKK